MGIPLKSPPCMSRPLKASQPGRLPDGFPGFRRGRRSHVPAFWDKKSRVSKARNVLCTIGYSGRSLPDFLAALRAQRVELVIDVRELPLSRRKGFSKTALRLALEAAGIQYRHVRAAGNPYRAEKANIKRCLSLYAAHLDRTPEALTEVVELVQTKRAALLCFEAEACECHRSVIAERLRRVRPALVVTDL